MTKVQITNTIEYDMRSRTFTCRNQASLTLTQTQSRCFEALLQTELWQPLHKDQLIALIWGKCNSQINYEPALIQKIYLLRKSLASIGLQDMIITIPRFGYQINARHTREIKFNHDSNARKGFISGILDKISGILKP
ncbi:winged helix-turn-helix domain-containing protein [Pantoea sp. B65]|uniref:winged helix-turn-helix domain-containing protein n=1 Tax=Pantoea sp. B65 TaxID=2813359 RepID=UPI0039B699C0